MKAGVFTALLSKDSLDEVLTKLERHGIHMAELGAGNHPGDAQCKLAMLDDAAAVKESSTNLRIAASRAAHSAFEAGPACLVKVRNKASVNAGG